MDFAEVVRCNLWKILETELSIPIPRYIKNIFKYQNLDNGASICAFTLSMIGEIETFAKSDVYLHQISPYENKKDYYGIYFHDPQDFKFTLGDKVLLHKIVDFVKDKDYTYWKPGENSEFSGKKHILSVSNIHEENDDNIGQYSKLLDMLIESNRNQVGKHPSSLRYAYELKLYASYIRMVGGPIVYETLQKNLPIPSISAIDRFINNTSDSITEGLCRVDSLVKFLNDRNLPLIICLSEDATGISGRIQYDKQSDQLIGFVLPMDQNSMPISSSFKATSAKEIESSFENGKVSTLLYTFMAQTLKKGSPSFCFNIFGTDNSFIFKDSLTRWNYMKHILNEKGISVLGYSSDGDPRLLKAMRIKANLGVKDSGSFKYKDAVIDLPEFHANITTQEVYVQDTVHIGTKLRNRLLKFSSVLAMGNFLVACTHLKMLIQILSKDKHLLTERDLSGADKMNFQSVLKISNPRIINLLKAHIPDSDGTQHFLTIINNVLESFLNVHLIPEKRIYKLWYSIFFLRMWRAWLSNNGYSVTDNFISLNSYICIELNGHSLLNLVFYCIENECFDYFLPWLFSSQPCESFFRCLRSMSTTYSTIVNCSVLEAINRLRKIQLQEDITIYNFQEVGLDINFPRKKFCHASFETRQCSKNTSEIPNISNCDINLESIRRTLDNAKSDAFSAITKLGMQVSIDEADNCDIKNIPDDTSDIAQDIARETEEDCESVPDDLFTNEDYVDDDDNDEEFLNDVDYLSNIRDLDLPDCSKRVTSSDEKSPYLSVRNHDGNEKLVRKSALCWLLNKGKQKLSTDRLQRVQQCEANKKNIYVCQEIDTVTEADEIQVGEWCLFKSEKTEDHLVGSILGFAYFDQKTWKKTEYSNDFAKIKGNVKNLGVLCHWYKVTEDRNLHILPVLTHGYIGIEYYRLTIPKPTFETDILRLTPSVYNVIKQYF